MLNIEEVTSDPHTLAREMVRDVGTHAGAPMRTLGHPVKYSDAETPIRRPAPTLGQHTAEVLSEYGFSEAEMVELLS